MKQQNPFKKALREAAKARACQIYLQVGQPIRWRCRREFTCTDPTPLSIDGWKAILGAGHSSDRRFDATIVKLDKRRFKARITYGDGNCLPYAVLTPILEINNAPSITSLDDALMARTGLVFVSGPPMSGRTTLVMQMIRFIRQNRTGSIATGELMIEHLLAGDGIFRTSFDFPIDAIECLAADGHDIVYIESIPDAETFDAILAAAEDRLVIASWNSSSFARTLTGLVYDYAGQNSDTRRIRQRLAVVFRGFIGTELIPTSPDSRYGRRYGQILAREIVVANEAMIGNIRDGDFHLVDQTIIGGRNAGMLPFNDDLRQLLGLNTIDAATFAEFQHQHHVEIAPSRVITEL
ncbi:MAG: hypothetical protein WC516_07490 [Patescibacteria group bacterium]